MNGNKVEDTSLLSVIDALKQNIARHTNVAGIYVIVNTSTNEELNVTTYTCKSCETEQSIVAYSIQGVNVVVGDYVLVLFCDVDYRQNYRRIRRGQATQASTSITRHDIAYGIIIGKL